MIDGLGYGSKRQKPQNLEGEVGHLEGGMGEVKTRSQRVWQEMFKTQGLVVGKVEDLEVWL